MTEIVSVSSNGTQATSAVEVAWPGHNLSGDGRFVAFSSDAINLVPGFNNGIWQIYVRDRLLSTTERVSVDSNGLEGNGISGLYGFSMSDDGRFVAFESASNNLVPGDTNGAREVFVHDRQTGVTEFVALDSAGVQGNGPSFYPAVSGDGRYVAFASSASNLVPGDTNGNWDTFVRDRVSGTTERVSVSFGGGQGNGDSYRPDISLDGRFVVFESLASNLVGSDTNGTIDVFLHDRALGTTRRASVSSTGNQGTGQSYLSCISGDGRYVSFWSVAPNLVPGDTNSIEDVFVHDFLLSTTERASVAADGSQANGYSDPLSISSDGRFVFFASVASNLVPGDTNQNADAFVRDRVNGTTERVSVARNGTQANLGGGTGSMSSTGRFVSFFSSSTNLVANDTNGFADIFLRDREASGFSSLCSPGSNNVAACPCGNPPQTSGRGCDNSSSTGGAVLSASGVAYLGLDSLVFSTSAEGPTATSLLVQGDAEVANGAVFGQGIRCLGGAIKRLYIKSAVNGSIRAPDLSAGDPTVSSRSALLGVTIQPGQPYFYLVYYRDPIVLGGCPASATFNTTQTGSVTWWP